MKSRPRRAAFSLVEVALALGIFGFVLVGLLGLVVVSTDSTRESAADTALGMMTQSTLARLRAQGFAAVQTAVTGGAYGSANNTPNFFYDVSGQMNLDAAGKPVTSAQAGSVYACVVRGRVPTTGGGTPTPSLIYLQLQFRSPAAAPTASQQVRTVNASIANYD